MRQETVGAGAYGGGNGCAAGHKPPVAPAEVPGEAPTTPVEDRGRHDDELGGAPSRAKTSPGYTPGSMAGDSDVIVRESDDNDDGHHAYVRGLREGSSELREDESARTLPPETPELGRRGGPMDVSNVEKTLDTHAEAAENSEPSFVERPFTSEATRSGTSGGSSSMSHVTSIELQPAQHEEPRDIMMISCHGWKVSGDEVNSLGRVQHDGHRHNMDDRLSSLAQRLRQLQNQVFGPYENGSPCRRLRSPANWMAMYGSPQAGPRAQQPVCAVDSMQSMWTAPDLCGQGALPGRHQSSWATERAGDPSAGGAASGVCRDGHEREDLPGQAPGEGQRAGEFSWSRMNQCPSPCRRALGTADDERAAEDNKREGEVGSDTANPRGAHRGDGTTDLQDAQDSFETIHLSWEEGEVRGDQEEGGHCGSIGGADDLRRRHGELRGGEDQGQGQEQPGQVSVLWKSLRDLQHRMRAWSARSLHVHVPPHRNRMAVRDGSCLRRAAGHGSFAGFESHLEHVSKASYKPPKRTAFEGQLVVAHLLSLKRI